MRDSPGRQRLDLRRGARRDVAPQRRPGSRPAGCFEFATCVWTIAPRAVQTYFANPQQRRDGLSQPSAGRDSSSCSPVRGKGATSREGCESKLRCSREGCESQVVLVQHCQGIVVTPTFRSQLEEEHVLGPGPCTRSSSMLLVALGPLIQVGGRVGSSAATASRTSARIWSVRHDDVVVGDEGQRSRALARSASSTIVPVSATATARGGEQCAH